MLSFNDAYLEDYLNVFPILNQLRPVSFINTMVAGKPGNMTSIQKRSFQTAPPYWWSFQGSIGVRKSLYFMRRSVSSTSFKIFLSGRASCSLCLLVVFFVNPWIVQSWVHKEHNANRTKDTTITCNY